MAALTAGGNDVVSRRERRVAINLRVGAIPGLLFVP